MSAPPSATYQVLVLQTPVTGKIVNIAKNNNKKPDIK